MHISAVGRAREAAHMHISAVVRAREAAHMHISAVVRAREAAHMHISAVGRARDAVQRKTDLRWTRREYSVCWIVSRTWSVMSNTSIGSSAAPSPWWAVSIGAPNSMIHLLGSGTRPSSPSQGNVGVIGT